MGGFQVKIGLRFSRFIPERETRYTNGILEKDLPRRFVPPYEILLATPVTVLCTRPPMWIRASLCKPARRLETSNSHIKSPKS